jgi:hypothetical protein
MIDQIKLNDICHEFELDLVLTSNKIKNLSDDQDKTKIKKLLKKMSIINNVVNILYKYRDTLD